MSNKASGWAWEQPITPSQKLVLLSLADRSDEDGICWPGTRNVEKRTGLSRATVKRALAQLETIGAIERMSRYRDDGSQRSSLYTLAIGGDHSDTMSVHTATQPGVTVIPHETSIEPSKKPTTTTIKTGQALIECFSAEELLALEYQYPSLNLQDEADACALWWKEEGRTMKHPKTAFTKWLKKAAEIQQNRGQNGKAAATQPSAVPDPDPTAKYKEFAERWKQH